MASERRSFLRATAVGLGTAVAGCSGALFGPDCGVEEVTTDEQAQPGGTYPMYQYDCTHSGYVPGSATPEGGKRYWRTTLGDDRTSRGAVVDNDTVFVAGEALYALRHEDGTCKWCSDVLSVGTTPAIADDLVVVGTRNTNEGDGGVLAFDVEDGSKVWQTADPGASNAGPVYAEPTVHDGRVYVAGSLLKDTANVSALDVSTGETVWNADPGTGHIYTITASEAGVFVMTESTLQRVSRSDGTVLWDVPVTVSRLAGAPVYAAGSVLAPSEDTTLCAWNAETGEREWEFTVPESTRFDICAMGETVYATTVEGLTAIDLATGDRRWKLGTADLIPSEIPTTDPRLGVPLATDDSIYFGLGEGLVAIDPSSDDRRWYHETRSVREGDVLRSGTPGFVSASDSTVFITTGVSDVYAIDK